MILFCIFREDKLFISMKRDILTVEELNIAARTWTPETFIKFYSDLYGTMTMEEFRKFNLDIINKTFPTEIKNGNTKQPS